MAEIFRPKSTGGGGFLGLQGAMIVGWTDRTAEFDWADLYWDIILQTEKSDYENALQLKGDFGYEVSPSGNHIITETTVIKRFYQLKDVIGHPFNLTAFGEFCDDDGNVVDAETVIGLLTEEFTASFATQGGANPTFPFCAYLYEVADRDGKTDENGNLKTYTRVVPQLQPNTDAGRAELEDYYTFLVRRGVITPYDGSQQPQQHRARQSGPQGAPLGTPQGGDGGMIL